MTQEILREIEEKIGYTFHNISLLKQAFTRSSYVNERAAAHTPADTQSNEVLEFFGDSVLSMCLAYLLLERYGELGSHGLVTRLGEADFSIIRSNMSDKRALADAIRRMGVGKFMRLSRGDFNQDVVSQDSPNEDLFESIIAAVALDSGMNFDILLDVVRRLDDVDRLLAKRGFGAAKKHPKSALKEFCEQRHISYHYEVLDTEGPEHAKTFHCQLTVEGFGTTQGTGASRSKAEAAAAEAMLEQLK